MERGKKRLKELGFRLQEFSRINYRDFFDQLKLMQLGHLSLTMDLIVELLEVYKETPLWWADDLKQYYKLLKKEALSKESVVPKEFRSTGDTDKDLRLFKDYIFKCGLLIEWWPEIWEASKNLNKEDSS